MINKMRTAQEAVAGIQDGMTIMVGGFLGTGTPEILIDALVPTTAACPLPSPALPTAAWRSSSPPAWWIR